MPFIHPKGMIVWNRLIAFLAQNCTREAGYVEIKTPQLMSQELWERSGHWDITAKTCTPLTSKSATLRLSR